jgi:hypothetical protein
MATIVPAPGPRLGSVIRGAATARGSGSDHRFGARRGHRGQTGAEWAACGIGQRERTGQAGRYRCASHERSRLGVRAWVVVGIVVVALVGLVMNMASRTHAAHAAPRRPRREPGAPPRRRRTLEPEIDLRERLGGQCPRCGRAETVTRSQRNRTLTSWRCGWCDHRWDVADGEPWPDVTLCLWMPRASAPIAREAP